MTPQHPFSLLAIAFLFVSLFSGNLIAQFEFRAGQTTGDSVHYVDIVPDYQNYTSLMSTYQVIYDVNNDGTNDILFAASSCCGGTTNENIVSVVGLGGTEVAINVLADSVPDVLSLDDSIHGGLVWLSDGELSYQLSSPGGSIIYGIWPGKYDKYLAFRLNVNGDRFYGWFRMSLTDSVWQGTGEHTIKDFAWRGDATAVSRDTERELSDLRLYPNPATNSIRIDFPGGGSSPRVEVIDLAGRRMNLPEAPDAVSEGRMELDLGNWPSGLYLLRLEADGKLFSKTFLKR